MVRGIMAEVLGLPLQQGAVLVDHMGGGFGAKQDLFQSEFLCALLARQTRRPVRMEYTREETFLGGRSRHPVKIWLKQGFRRDGTDHRAPGAGDLQLRRLRFARAGRDHRRHQRV